MSLTIEFDYSYDSLGFFTSHPAAKTVLEEAAQIVGSQINDQPAAIVPDVADGNTWSETFPDPSTGSMVSVSNPTVPANTIIVYAGGSSSNDGFAGDGGTGGYQAYGTQAWNTLVATRGASGAVGGWGGKVSFNMTTPWSFVGTSGAPLSGQYDFLTVAEHELGHVLGLGTSTAWQSDVNTTNDTFTGAHAEATYGGPVPLNYSGEYGEVADTHWGASVLSYGIQPMMSVTPLLDGFRKSYTSLDWSALEDIGWHIDQAVVTSQPPSSLAFGSDFAITVSIEDPAGHVDSLFDGPVTISLGQRPEGGTLSGTLTVNAVDGVAYFSGLGLNLPGSTYSIDVSASEVGPATSNPIVTSTPNAIGHFVITTQLPSSLTAGALFGFSATIEDSDGNTLTQENGPVTLDLVSGPSGGQLFGTTTVDALNGIVLFTGLSLTKAGFGYEIQLSSSSISPALTSALQVVPATAAQLVISSQPPSLVTVGWPFGLRVQVTDAFGNPLSDRSDQVTLSLANNPGGASLAGTTSVFALNGVATFTGLTLDKISSGVTLKATAAGLNSAITGSFSIVSGAPANLVIVGQPPSSVSTGSGFTVVADVNDAAGDLSENFSGTAIISLASNPGNATLTGPLTVNVVGGVATFSGLILNNPGIGFVLQVQVSSGQGTTTGAFNVVGRPGYGGPDQALSISSVVAIFTGKGKKRKLLGFEIDYGSAVGVSAFNPGNYVIMENFKKGKKLIAKQVGLSTSQGSVSNSVRLTLIGKHPFALGGTFLIDSSPPSGIIGANGNYLLDGNQTITILRNVSGIQ